MKRASIIYYLGLIALIAIVLYNHFFAFFGHNGSDDLYYAALAKQLNDGTLHLTNDHYAFRWGILLPVAICYRLFGINDFSTALPAFISTLLAYSLYIVLPANGITLSGCLHYHYFFCSNGHYSMPIN